MIHPIDQLKLAQPVKKDDSAAQFISMAAIFAGLYLLLRKPEQPVGESVLTGNPTWSGKTSFDKPSLHDLERAIVDLRYAPKAAWSDEVIGALLVIHPTEVKVKLADHDIVTKNLNLLGLKHHRDKQFPVFREREKTELIEELKNAYNLNWRISRRGLNKMGSNIAPSHFTDILGRVSSKTIFTILESLGIKEL